MCYIPAISLTLKFATTPHIWLLHKLNVRECREEVCVFSQLDAH